MNYIDLRSDTVTQPTEEMRQAMRDAPVGDDVYRDDPTVNRLEAAAAERLGKEAALFVPTGTMGNQIGIMAQTRPGDEIIAGVASHVFINEAGGHARLSGVSCALVQGRMSAAGVDRLVRPVDIHYPRTTLVCVENALGNGDVMTLDEMRGIAAAAAARRRRLSIHLDGARIFNAAVALGVDARDIAACADSVMFCISKGLCSPVGSLLCGSADFIDAARRCRKLLGGGMRQAGVLAACGLVSLDKMVSRLAEDHGNARRLARGLSEGLGWKVDLEAVKINMVFASPPSEKFNHGKFVAFMLARGVKINAPAGGSYRMVTHHGVARQDVDAALAHAAEFAKGGA